MSWNTPVVAGNELWRLVALFGLILAGAIASRIGHFLLARSATRLDSHHRVVAAATLRALGRSAALLTLAVIFPFAVAMLVMGDTVRDLLAVVEGVLISLGIGFTLYQLVDVVFVWLKSRSSKSGSKMDEMLIPLVQTSLRVTIVALTALQIAQSLTDKPLTSIIAGLGVGGLAVALAAQDTIKHFFGSLVLFADKPFQVGDRVTVDQADGTVEEVGFRSTRIRTLEGYLVTIPNGDLANKVITNIGKRPHIRHRAIIGITYDTPPEKVERALVILRELLDQHEGMQPDFPPRIAFHELGAYSLNIMVLFWYHPADFWSYMSFAEQFNLRMLERFNREGIAFAFPTQTLHLAGDSHRGATPA